MRIFLFISLFLLSFQGAAQQDSITARFYIEGTIAIPGDSSMVFPLVKTEITVEDIDFLGEIFIEAFDSIYQSPLAKVKYTAAQIIANGFNEGNRIRFDVMPLATENPVLFYTRATDYIGGIRRVVKSVLNP